MRIRDLRDWPSCLVDIRQSLDYSNFQTASGETEDEVRDRVLVLSGEIDEEIAEGMLHTVVSLPLPEASRQLERFAAGLQELTGDPVAETASEVMAAAYREFLNELTRFQRGLPAVVETFQAYAEGRYDLRKEPAEVLNAAHRHLRAEPHEALRLLGEAACLVLRDMGEADDLWPYEGGRSPKEPLVDWIHAAARVLHPIVQKLEEYPLGEVELARDQWRAPDDKERIEYRRGKLARLGVLDPEVQTLLLPLLDPGLERLPPAESTAIIAAGPKVAGGLIAIAGDADSQIQGSVSGGEAAIRAVELLGDMRAAEAVPALLEILRSTDFLAIIHDRALQVLQDEMPDLAFAEALDIFDHTPNVNYKSEMAGILAKGGQGQPGVFERLIKYFQRHKGEQDLIAGYLADLGDRRALSALHEAFRRANDWTGVVEIEDAIVRLGGELSPVEAQKFQRLKAETLPAPAPARPFQPALAAKPVPVRVTKIGRNEPCPCGSGKKYKKCCGR